MKHLMKMIKQKASYKMFDKVVLIYPEGINRFWYIVPREYFDKKVKETGGHDWIFGHVPPYDMMYYMISQKGLQKYKDGIFEPSKEDFVSDPEQLLKEGKFDLVVLDQRLINAMLIDLDGEVVPRHYIFKMPRNKVNTKRIKECCELKKISILSKNKNFIECKCNVDKQDLKKLIVKNGLYYKPITMFTLGRYLNLFKER